MSTASQALFGDDRPLWQWTAALGFTSGPGQDRGILDPVEALAFIIHAETDAICLMKDLPALFATNPALIRALRDVYDALSSRPGCVVLSHPSIDIPAGLGKEVYLLELALPDAAELHGLLTSLNQDYAEDRRVSAEWLERISFATQGLSSNETRDLFHQLMNEAVLDVDAAISCDQPRQGAVADEGKLPGGHHQNL